MQIRPPSYKKCPHCGEKNIYYESSFSDRYVCLAEWSDGEDFKGLPGLKKRELQKCDFCNNFFWFRQYGGGMTFRDYCDALIFFENLYSKNTIIDFVFPYRKNDRLLYIRLNILRRYNDRIRIHPFSKGKKEPKLIHEDEKNIFINNAFKLIELLKMLEPNNYFLISELYRNIGLFEESKAELYKIDDENKKSLLLREIENNNCDVIIISQRNICY